MRVDNAGRARVCARRAAGQSLAWYLTRHPHPTWRKGALDQLMHLKDDAAFPQQVRDAAARLTTRITPEFTYPSDTDPLTDAKCIIDYIVSVMEQPDAR